MKIIEERTGMDVLDESECLEVLRSTQIGRVGVVEDGRPLIVPVNYVVDGHSIIFRSADGAKFSAAVNGAPMSFEVDVIDMRVQTGTSVLVSGQAELVTDPSELTRITALGLHPWATGAKPHVIRVPIAHLSGRQIAPSAHSEIYLG